MNKKPQSACQNVWLQLSTIHRQSGFHSNTKASKHIRASIHDAPQNPTIQLLPGAHTAWKSFQGFNGEVPESPFLSRQLYARWWKSSPRDHDTRLGRATRDTPNTRITSGLNKLAALMIFSSFAHFEWRENQLSIPWDTVGGSSDSRYNLEQDSIPKQNLSCKSPITFNLRFIKYIHYFFYVSS